MYNLQRYPINLYLVNNVKDVVVFFAPNLINFDNSHPLFLQGKMRKSLLWRNYMVTQNFRLCHLNKILSFDASIWRKTVYAEHLIICIIYFTSTYIAKYIENIITKKL